jgi:hypothetical protein
VTPEILQLVEVWDDRGEPVEALCGQFVFAVEHLYMGDKFKDLLVGNKSTRVRREVAETIGCAGFSSIKVSTSIEVTCDQNEKSVKAAAAAIYDECALLNEDAIMKAHEGLMMHRKVLKLDR